jgi:hypothetical protein
MAAPISSEAVGRMTERYRREVSNDHADREQK